jgi:hypothetical protein
MIEYYLTIDREERRRKPGVLLCLPIADTLYHQCRSGNARCIPWILGDQLL